ncbi:MAG: DUF2156 domain-containing protein [Ruminococcaceae bacterium]|nr:DUF2156 domain-containing protein [Oscillospiraceae bacterium]
MIEFQSLTLEQADTVTGLLQCAGERGCEYSFANLYLWGRQKAAIHQGNLALFSQFNRKSVYPFPLGKDVAATLDAIIHDAAARGIPCRITGLLAADCHILETLYPDRFRFHQDRDSWDYIYDINDLADLKGRKYQKKRNHINRFYQDHPEVRWEPIDEGNLDIVTRLVAAWYEKRQAAVPGSDFHMEKAAIKKALANRRALKMEGLLLYVNEEPTAMTMGSRLSEKTFDVHFEKAILEDAYPVINQLFARYLRQAHPELCWLDREEDMGLEGLRKAKLSYCPHHMVEKSWACLLEDGCEY